MNLDQSPVSTGSIQYLQLCMASDKIVEKRSYCRVQNNQQYKDNKPAIAGLFDPHMGTTDMGATCATCGYGSSDCLGHCGHFMLSYPVIRELFSPLYQKWLKIICLKCSKLVFDEALIATVSNRFDAAVSRAKKIVKDEKQDPICFYCQEPIPNIPLKDKKMIFPRAEYRKTGESRDLYPHIVKRCFDGVTDELVAYLGIKPEMHPRNLTAMVLAIPPVTMRAINRGMSSGPNNQGLTSILHKLIELSNKINKGVSASVGALTPDDERMIVDLNMHYWSYIKAPSAPDGGDVKSSSLMSPIKGKKGLPRANICGKTVKGMIRAVISCDPTISVEEVNINIVNAMKSHILEVCTPYNYDKLMVYFLNGPDRYPGAEAVIKRGSKRRHNIKAENPPKLEIGDELLRHMITGDILPINRQPSLLYSSIAAMRVRVVTNPNILPMSFNVLLCPAFNADFDGDQMGAQVVTHKMSIVEVTYLSSVKEWLLSYKAGIIFGQALDSIIGLALLTSNGVKLNKKQAMYLFTNVLKRPVLANREYTGRELISMVIPSINYTRKAKFYNSSYTPFIDYDEDEINVEIHNGQLIRGVLDKNSVGQGVFGNIYHVIALKFGPKTALDCIFNMQQMALYYLNIRSFTVSYGDMILPEGAIQEIKQIQANIFTEAAEMTKRYDAGEIIAPIGQTTNQFYEASQIAILRRPDAYVEPIMKNTNIKTNNLLQMVLYGVKGSINDLYAIVASVGQIIIDGGRLKQDFAAFRTLPYYPRYSTDPEAHGYVKNGYFHGMSPVGTIHDAKNSRKDIITKALSTSISGTENRNACKCMENLLIDYNQKVVSDFKIVQFVYGDDGADPRKLDRIKVPSIMLNNEELRERFYMPEFEEEFEQIMRDRDEFRERFCIIERVEKFKVFSDTVMCAVNVARIVKDHLAATTSGIKIVSTNNVDIAELKEMRDDVRALCEEFPYLCYAKSYRGPLPAHAYSACKMLLLIIRCELSPPVLARMNRNILHGIIQEIKFTYLNSLMAPGKSVGIISALSVSEPLTQYMLDSQHRTGEGSSREGIENFENILRAKPPTPTTCSTTLPLLGEYATNESLAQELAHHIEELVLKSFLTHVAVLVEEYGKIIDPRFASDKKIFEEFEKYQKLRSRPTNLINWCIRLQLDRVRMMLKTLSMDDVIIAIAKQYPDLYCVYTQENDDNLIIRIYIQNTLIKKGGVKLSDIRQLCVSLQNMIVRGIPGITQTQVVKVTRHEFDVDGKMVRKNINAIMTKGTNLYAMALCPHIDAYTMQSDNSVDTRNFFGIEAAKQRILASIRGVLAAQNIDFHNYITYADQMVVTGDITGIDKLSIKNREFENILLRISTSHPVQTLLDALNYSVVNKIYGVSAALMVGATPNIGTKYSKVLVNTEFVKNNVYDVTQEFE